jgi:hypothetical protein
MQYGEIMAVYHKNHVGLTKERTVCRQNVQLFNTDLAIYIFIYLFIYLVALWPWVRLSR